MKDAAGVRMGQERFVENRKEGSSSKFMGAKEMVIQEEKLTPECAAKSYLQKDCQ